MPQNYKNNLRIRIKVFLKLGTKHVYQQEVPISEFFRQQYHLLFGVFHTLFNTSKNLSAAS